MGVVRKRVLLLLCIMAALFIMGITGWLLQEQHSLGLLYEQTSLDTCATAGRLVDLLGERLTSLTCDYTYWDEMVDFVKTRDPKWAKINLVTALDTFAADSIVVYDPDGRKVYSVNKRRNPTLLLPDLRPEEIKHLFSAGPLCHFFLKTRVGLLEVRGAKIVPSADSARVGPTRGYFLASQIWDSKYLKVMASILNAKAFLQSAPDGEMTPDERYQRVIFFRQSLPGPDNRIIETLCVTKQFAQGDIQRAASQRTIILLCLFAVMMIIVIALGLSRYVTCPLGLISSAMETQSSDALPTLENDPSEFGRLAALIHKFFHQEQLLRESEGRFDQLAEQNRTVAWEVDTHGLFSYASHVSDDVLGYRPDELVGHLHLYDVIPEVEQEPFRGIIFGLFERKESFRDLESLAQTKDGCQIWILTNGIPLLDADGDLRGYRGTYTDITERKLASDALVLAKREIEEHVVKLGHQATHDALTGLYNRHYFERRLEKLIHDDADERSDAFTVLFLDVDKLKLVNDTLGHKIGDLLLIEVSQRLHSCLRSEDTLARIGGDEFTMILPHCSDRSIAQSVASRMVDRISSPFDIDGHRFLIGASIGLAGYPCDAMDAGTLLRHADAAMYESKQSGRATFHWYDADVDRKNQEQAEMEMDIRSALERGQLRVDYQPIISLEHGTILKAEALLRWDHPKRGMISPNVIIPIAEKVGMIGPIGDFVLRTSCAQLAAWRGEGVELSRIAVNVSIVQAHESGWLDSVTSAISEAGIEAGSLDLEVTETGYVVDYESVKETLLGAHRLGISLSIDDFGIGQSSLSRFKDFPVIDLKIDGSFIKHIEDDPSDYALVHSIVEMAHGQEIKVTAEWVETESQMEILRSIGCDFAQGYFISPAMTATDFGEFFRRWTSS